MTTFARVMVFVMWLVGAMVSGPTIQWTHPETDAKGPSYTVAGVLQMTLHEQHVALRLGTVGPWQVELAADVPAALIDSMSRPAVAKRRPADPAAGAAGNS